MIYTVSCICVDISLLCSLFEAVKGLGLSLLAHSIESSELFVQTTFAALASVYCFPTWREYVIGKEPSIIGRTKNRIAQLQQLQKSLFCRTELIQNRFGENEKISFPETVPSLEDNCSLQERTWHDCVQLLYSYVDVTFILCKKKLGKIAKRCQVRCKWALIALIVLMSFGAAVYLGPFVFLFLWPLLAAKRRVKKLYSDIKKTLKNCNEMIHELEEKASEFMKKRAALQVTKMETLTKKKKKRKDF